MTDQIINIQFPCGYVTAWLSSLSIVRNDVGERWLKIHGQSVTILSEQQEASLISAMTMATRPLAALCGISNDKQEST